MKIEVEFKTSQMFTCSGETECQGGVKDGWLQPAGQHQPGQAQVEPGLGKGALLDIKGNCAFADLRYGEEESITSSPLIFPATKG